MNIQLNFGKQGPGRWMARSIARQRLSKHVNTHATVERVAAPRLLLRNEKVNISAAVSRHATIAAA
jgi:hypothetical protein